MTSARLDVPVAKRLESHAPGATLGSIDAGAAEPSVTVLRVSFASLGALLARLAIWLIKARLSLWLAIAANTSGITPPNALEIDESDSPVWAATRETNSGVSRLWAVEISCEAINPSLRLPPGRKRRATQDIGNSALR